MYKNLKTPAVECLENGNYHCTGNFFLQNNIFFKIDELIAENPKSSKQTFEGTISEFGKSPSLFIYWLNSLTVLMIIGGHRPVVC